MKTGKAAAVIGTWVAVAAIGIFSTTAIKDIVTVAFFAMISTYLVCLFG